MKKLFTQKLKLCAALCALFALGCPNVAADDNDPADGYYFIVNRDKYGSEATQRAWRLFPYSHRLAWDSYDTTEPEQIFYLKKTTDNKNTNAYYLQNLADGSWFYGQAWDNNLYLRNDKDLKNTLEFEKQDDGSFNIKPTINRDLNEIGTTPNTYYLSTNGAARAAIMWQSNTSGSKQQNWNLVSVTEDQLNAALKKLKRHDNNLIKAYNIYNSNLAYNEGATGLINTITAEPEDVHYGKGTQIFVSYKENDAGKFANITNSTTSNNYFQATYGTHVYADNTTTVEAPQFFQVDLEKSVKGVRMEMNATNYNGNGWCASSQWADVTLYATNDEDAAFNCYTIAQCEQSDKWVKIGEFEPDLSKSLVKNTTTVRADGSTEYFTWYTKTDENKVYNTLGLKNTGYRYVRFYVNNEPFPNSKVMNYVFTGFQLYELEDVAVVGSKKYLINQLLDAEKTYESILKDESTTKPTEAQVNALTDAIEAVEKNASVSITDIGYSTFVSDEKVQLPADSKLEAYIVKSQDGNYAVLEKIAEAGEVIPANTPVLIKGDKGDYLLPISTADAVSITDENLLKGEARAITAQADGTTYYTLQNGGGKAVFKKYNPSLKLNAGYAYLPVATSAASPALLNISFDAATGIQSAVNAETKDAKTYDLEGRSVKNPQKGIYIRDGKKVVIK